MLKLHIFYSPSLYKYILLEHNNELDINELRQIIDSVIATQCDVNQSCADIREWPSHLDVLRAFAVFDQEGHGSVICTCTVYCVCDYMYMYRLHVQQCGLVIFFL